MKANVTIKEITSGGSFTVPPGVTALEIEGYLRRIRRIATGDAHTLCLLDDGSLMAWGKNTNGELGDGTVINKSAPVLVSTGGRKFVAVEAGLNWSLALAEDGQAYAWGVNTWGQLGDNTIIPKSTPTLVLGGFRYSKISAGNNHALAMLMSTDFTLDKTLKAWGYNGTGALGDNTIAHRSTPVTVLAGSKLFKDISAGLDYSLAITDTYYDNISFLTVEGGDMYAWGANDKAAGAAGSGHLGTGNPNGKISIPTLVIGGHKWTMCEAGDYTSYGLKTTGFLYAWGSNDINYGGGALGDGTIISKSSPVMVKRDSFDTSFPVISNGEYITQISAKAGRVCVIAGGNYYGWGENGTGLVAAKGTLGDGSIVNKSYPVYVAIGTQYVDVCDELGAGGSHTVWGASDGRLYACGNAILGQIGDGTTVVKSSPVLVSASGRRMAMIKDQFKGGVTMKVEPGDQFTFQIANGLLLVKDNARRNYFAVSDTTGFFKLIYNS